ncbi:MAG: hypothetical protein C0399_01985 [Syntrophus sp. (in: bacteria)]|nr:hypothetical protein [Syntrophus sp. (in: bacteria)]
MGYTVQAQSFSFSPKFKTEIIQLAVAKSKDDSFLFTSAQLGIESNISRAIKGEVERIILKEPKIRIRLGNEKETETDLSFIRNIPPVDLLIIEKGEFKLLFASSAQEIILKDINLTIKNFSSATGGTLTFRGLVDIAHPDKSQFNSHGTCKGEIHLTGLLPRLIGSGFLEITLDSGGIKGAAFKDVVLQMVLTFEKERIRISKMNIAATSIVLEKEGKRSEMKGAALKTGIIYDLKSKTISTENFLGEIPKLGAFKGSYSGTLTGAMPWKAQLETSQIDFSSLYTSLQPLIAGEEGKKWSIQGKGTLKTDMEGTLSGKKPTLSGKAIFQFQKGGFNSQDGSRAAQGIEGSIVLKFSIPSEEKKVGASLSSELSGGEYLWGKYYRDFTKETARLSTETDFSIDSNNAARISGTADLFNTGKYSYSGFLNNDTWNASINAREVGVKRLVSLFLYDYLVEILPFFKGLETDGNLYADITTSSLSEKDLRLKGMVKLNNAYFKIPDKSFRVTGIDIDLPFNLSRASLEKERPSGDEQERGSINIADIEKDTMKFSHIKIPLILAGRGALVPETVTLPFYGGQIRFINVAIGDILSPKRKVSLTTKIENVDLGTALNELTGITFPGSVEAHFPLITYQDDRLATEGRTSVKAFGGEIEAAHVYAENIFSASRKIGGDVSFHNIDLGKITDTIKIGKITGIVEGSLKNLAIEYGQPSQFVFELGTVKKSGVPRKVSVDAIESISILGTGSGGIGAILKSGINKFFKEYPYSRIGIRCGLENDHFNIRGTIHEGGKEYLIRKAFFRGIDVVNKDPENVVSFKDMQERVSRVLKSSDQEKVPAVKVN